MLQFTASDPWSHKLLTGVLDQNVIYGAQWFIWSCVRLGIKGSLLHDSLEALCCVLSITFYPRAAKYCLNPERQENAQGHESKSAGWDTKYQHEQIEVRNRSVTSKWWQLVHVLIRVWNSIEHTCKWAKSSCGDPERFVQEGPMQL